MSITEAIAYLKCDDPAIETEDTVLVPDGLFPAHLSLDNGLSCYYLLDKGDHFEYVQKDHLNAHAESLESLHNRAVTNLSNLASKNVEVRQYGNIFVATMGGNFEASLLLVTEFWDEDYSHTVENGFVAAIPARDIMAFCDSQSTNGIEELRAAISRIWPSGDHLLTDRLYRRVGRRWEIYDA